MSGRSAQIAVNDFPDDPRAAREAPGAAHVASGAAAKPRRLALTVIATLTALFALHWARAFLVPLLLGMLIAYTLNPLVARMERLKIPRSAGAGLAVFALIVAGALSADTLGGQVRSILAQLPEASAKISAQLAKRHDGEPGTMAKVQAAAHEIAEATAQVTGDPPVPRKSATRVVVEPRGFRVSTFLWENSMGFVVFAVQASMVVLLVFFLLSSGDTFKRKLVRLAGPSMSSRKITVQALDDINTSIQQFMLMLLASNLILALMTWSALRFIGLENAGAWALAAGVLHLVPYVGPALVAAAVAMAAFMQFESLAPALGAAGATLAIAAFTGMIVTTWMTGKFARMNPVAVFVALLFWGWLWGIWGVLLAIPIVVTLKVVAENVEPLRPLAELMRR